MVAHAETLETRQLRAGNTPMVPPQQPSGQVDIYPGHRLERTLRARKLAALTVQNWRESITQKRLDLNKGRIPAPAAKSTLHKSGYTAPGLVPSVGHLDDIPWRSRRFQTFEEHRAIGPVAFSYNPYAAVDEVLRHPHEAEFERVTPDPPAKADALYPPAHPDRHPGLLAERIAIGRSDTSPPWASSPFPVVMPAHQRPRRGLG